MTKIKAIIFDVGGVLTSPKHDDSHNYMAHKLCIKKQTWLKKIEPEYTLFVCGKISQEKVLKNISKRLGLDKEKFRKMWFNTYKKLHKKNIPMFNLVRKLKKDYVTAILSDQSQFSNVVVKKFNFYKFFDPIILSFELGVRKPELKIYKIILKRLELKPQECIFIDNKLKNILPAKKLGIHTILFKNINQLKKDLVAKGIKI